MITQDAVADSNVQASVANYSFNLVIGSLTNGGITVEVMTRGVAGADINDIDITGITVGGVALSLLAKYGKTGDTATTGVCQTEIWGGVGTFGGAGTKAVAITFTGTVNHSYATAQSLNGVNQADMLGASTGFDGSNLTTASPLELAFDQEWGNSWIIDAMYHKSGDTLVPKALTGQTIISALDKPNGGGDTAVASYKADQSYSGFNTMGWSFTTGDGYCWTIVEIKASGEDATAIKCVGRTGNSATSGTAVTSPVPSGNNAIAGGILANDVALAIINANGPKTVTDNNGADPFTKQINTDYNGPSASGHVWYRVLDGGETSDFAFTLSGSDRWGIEILVFRGVDTADPFDAEPAGNTGSGATVTSPAMTTGVTDAMGIAVGYIDDTAATFTAVPGNGYEYIDQRVGQLVGVAIQNFPSAGVQSAVTWTSSVATGWNGHQFSLKPATVASTAVKDPIGMGVVPFAR